MVNFFKKNFSSEKIGILVLAILTIVSGFIFYTQKDFSVETKTKSSSTSKDQNSYYFDDEYYGYDYENDMFYTSNDDYYYDDEYYYDDYYYDNYYDNYYYDNYGYNDYYYYDYSDTTKPSISGSNSKIVYQYQNYDPMEDISAYHSKFGDMTGAIEITYNDVDTNIPGTYSTVYKVCNYPGSTYCRTKTRSVTVRARNFDLDDDYARSPKWSNTDDVSCSAGSSKCHEYNIEEPIARDPVSNRKLDVSLISGYVDIYQEGTYVLVYYAETENGVSGTQTIRVDITGSYSSNSNSSYNQQKKYVQNQTSEYYDDGYYRGYLTPEHQQSIPKYIEDYKWENVVGYKYRCDVVGQKGTDGWSYVSTDLSNGKSVENADNNPTYNYDNGVFSGTLNKTNFYCKENCGTEINSTLGVCQNEGEIKYVYKTWVGVYSGYVYSNNNNNTTYSGYVYRYR